MNLFILFHTIYFCHWRAVRCEKPTFFPFDLLLSLSAASTTYSRSSATVVSGAICQTGFEFNSSHRWPWLSRKWMTRTLFLHGLIQACRYVLLVMSLLIGAFTVPIFSCKTVFVRSSPTRNVAGKAIFLFHLLYRCTMLMLLHERLDWYQRGIRCHSNISLMSGILVSFRQLC